MQFLPLTGCLVQNQSDQGLNTNKTTNALNVNDTSDGTILKAIDIQNMLHPMAVIEQTNRSNIHLDSQQQQQQQQQQQPRRLPGISELLPSLYLCGAGVAIPCFIEQLGITCIVNAAPELPDTPLPATKPLYYQVPVLDRGDIDLKYYFDEVADLIEQVRQSGGRSMVHCVAGVSRSASLCIAYLMKHGHMTLRDAFEHVRRLRPQIRPNVGFFRQLIEYERMLYGTVTVTFIFVESLAQEIPDVYEPEYRAMEVFYQKHRNVKRR